jgi:hypothetical protein
MKLEIILDKLGSLEKNSFIKIVDNIISKSTKNSKEIEKLLVTGDKSLKSVDNQNITKIFELIENEFKNSKFKEFPHVLFRDIVINEERILKAINK